MSFNLLSFFRLLFSLFASEVVFSASAVLARLELWPQVSGSEIFWDGMAPGWKRVKEVSKLHSFELTQKNQCECQSCGQGTPAQALGG